MNVITQNTIGTTEQWQTANPRLYAGVWGIEILTSGTMRFKVGAKDPDDPDPDPRSGITLQWNDLPYISETNIEGLPEHLAAIAQNAQHFEEWVQALQERVEEEEARAAEAEGNLQDDIDTRAKEDEFGQTQTTGDPPTLIKDAQGNWQIQGFMRIVQEYYESRLHMDATSGGPTMHILNKNIQGEAALLLNYANPQNALGQWLVRHAPGPSLDNPQGDNSNSMQIIPARSKTGKFGFYIFKDETVTWAEIDDDRAIASLKEVTGCISNYDNILRPWIQSQINDAGLQVQLWKPAVDTVDELPEITGGDKAKTWLCRVRDTNTVYQILPFALDYDPSMWEIYSTNTDYVDPLELADAIEAAITGHDTDTAAHSDIRGQLSTHAQDLLTQAEAIEALENDKVDKNGTDSLMTQPEHDKLARCYLPGDVIFSARNDYTDDALLALKRRLLLKGQKISNAPDSDYRDLIDNSYVGDDNNNLPDLDGFYKCNADGTRNTQGTHYMLPDSRGTFPRIAGINSRHNAADGTPYDGGLPGVYKKDGGIEIDGSFQAIYSNVSGSWIWGVFSGTQNSTTGQFASSTSLLWTVSFKASRSWGLDRTTNQFQPTSTSMVALIAY
jgi:hypothetical protein